MVQVCVVHSIDVTLLLFALYSFEVLDSLNLNYFLYGGTHIVRARPPSTDGTSGVVVLCVRTGKFKLIPSP